MNKMIKNTLAIITGLIMGSALNMGIIMISGSIIQPPNGVDVNTMDGLKESIHLFEPRHYIFPFLAHATGTFIGAYIASLIASNHKMKIALIIGTLFLVGGIANSLMIPAHTWFIVMDLILAYIPMAWLGYKLVRLRISTSNNY
jgi:hypothetical protein